MEVPKGISLYSYLKPAKMTLSSFLFFLYKIGEQEGRTGPAWEGCWYQWEWGRGEERV
jgi:hypothetical protein